MSIRQALIQAACVLVLSGHICAAELAQLSLGRGHLALQAEGGDWRCLQLGDPLPAVSQLRTSPAGPVRIDVQQTAISLAGDTSLTLDQAQKRIVLEYGRVLLRPDGEDATWTVTAGPMAFLCPAGCEVEISYAETVGVNVLKQAVHVSGPKHDGIELKAPLQWASDDQGAVSSDVPDGKEWVLRIRQRTEPRPEQGLGQLVAKDPQSNSPVRLEVAQYHVNVTLKAPLALVQIDQSFFNPFHRQEEGTFIFNLPEGASVSRFAMYVEPDRLIEGELIDRERADQVYTTIVRSKRDPAILEQIGHNLFRMRVFPIFAHDTKRILLDYTVPLVADHGRYHFELPLMSDLKPIWDFSIRGTISPPFAPQSIGSPSHSKLKFSQSNDGDVTFSMTENDYRPSSRLLIDYRAPDRSEPFVRTFESDPKHQYFAITLPASANPLKDEPKPAPTDVLVLIDTSESATDLKLARQVARTLVRNLRPEDRCQLGCVDLQFRPVTKEWLSPRSAQTRQALKQLDEVFALGGSKLDAGVSESLTVFADAPPDRRQVVIYVGDGEVTLESEQSCWRDNRLQTNARQRIEFHAVELGGSNRNGDWLKTGIKQSQGRLFKLPGAGIRPLFEWALAGVPASSTTISCRCTNTEQVDLFHDANWPVGHELEVYGTCPAQKTLELFVAMPGQREHKYELAVPKSSNDDPFAGRLWAAEKLNSLLDGPDANSPKIHADVVRLCQEWSLMSPYTAFLVLEFESDYERWKIPRSLRHQYWKPFSISEGDQVHRELLKLASERGRQVGFNGSQSRPITKLPTNNLISPNLVRQYLESAKQAIAQKNGSVAMSYLNAIPFTQRNQELAQFNALVEQARQEQRRESVLSGMNLWASLLDRTAGDPLPPVSPLFLGLAYSGANAEYEQRHPYTTKFLRPAPDFGADKVNVLEMADAIKKVTGLPVIVDHKELQDAGISAQQKLLVGPFQGLPLRTISDFALDSATLTAVRGQHLIRITTQERAEEYFETHVYPVNDFVNANVMPSVSQLANPILDYEYRQRTLIESKLKQPINIDFKDIPIRDAIAYVLADIPHLIDEKELSDAGINLKSEISLTLEKLPREIVLRELLTSYTLDYYVRGGATVITTMEKSEERMETRIYSAAGIVDENQSDAVTPGKFGYGGYGFGGMGGMGMGGGMIGGLGGGMFGGMGGGMGGGMAPMGGGMGGLGGAVRNAARDDGGRIAPPNIEDADAEDPVSLQPGQVNEAVPQFNVNVSTMPVRDVGMGMRVLQQSTPGKWEDQDGEGGRISFDPYSFSFVVRQTRRVHAETKDLFEKIRKLSQGNRKGVRTAVTPKKQNELTTQLRYRQLMHVIQQSTPGKWMDSEGEGGQMTPQLLTSSLVIRQSDKVHDEVEQLLAQLRRARFVAQNLPWMTSLQGIDDLGTMLDRPTITDLPRNNAEVPVDGPNYNQKLRLLSVRKLSGWRNQRWRNQAKSNNQPRDVSIRRHAHRIELGLPDRTIRADGARAAVAYPGLTLVEVDLWGDAGRQVADATFPWLPHRTNAEIARHFDVTQEAENADEVTLRFILPGSLDTYLRVTYSKQNGQPLIWQSFVAGRAAHELRIEPKIVIAIDPSGAELERWDLVNEEPEKPIASLESNWGDFIVVETSKPNMPLLKARQLMREGNLSGARTIFEGLLKEHPKQALINFLYAWTLRLPESMNPDQVRQQQTALQRVAAAGPSELLMLMTPGNFPALGEDGLRNALLPVPFEHRNADVWNTLAQLAIDQADFDTALDAVEHAIGRTSDPLKLIRSQLRKVDLLLRNGRPVEADALGRSLANQEIPLNHLLDLGDLFAQANQIEMSNFYYDRYRAMPGLPRRDQVQASIRQGLLQQRNDIRWQAMIEAIVELGENPYLVNVIASEASSFEDAKILAKLTSTMAATPLQLRLLRRQLEIDRPAQQAELAVRLLRENRLYESEIENLIPILDAGGRRQDVIDIVEGRLKRGERIDLQLLRILAASYQQLGRTADFARAESGEPEHLQLPSASPMGRSNQR